MEDDPLMDGFDTFVVTGAQDNATVVEETLMNDD